MQFARSGAVVLVALGVGLVLSRGSATTLSAADAPSAAVASIPADVEAQLKVFPAGTVIVPCSPAVAVLPEGVRPITPPGYALAHPAFSYLLHGYCADNPKTTPIPVKLPLVDG